MKRKPTYDKVLFIILMTLLFLPLLQGYFHFIFVKPLNGVTLATEQPEFSFSSYRSGDYARQKEAYLSENFGFREPIIRLYNQYLWTCYKKTYTKDVVAGKDGWLYYPQSVRDYYGKELLKWQPSVEEAKRHFDLEVKYLSWTRAILKENGVDFMVFLAPEKGFLYPEHLPDDNRDTTTFNACKYFNDRFEEIGFPCIEMTRWFKQIKDTIPYLLIPQTGGHWNFSSVYAADSLFRFMGNLKGIELPKIHIGELHDSAPYVYEAETDLEQLLNLMCPIRQRQALAPEADVYVESGPTTVKPKVLFIGNSFFWRIAHYLPLDQIFSQFEFWYYNSKAYFGACLNQTCSVGELNLLEKLLDFDYVVWFTTGNQMYKGTAGFAPKALVALTLDDDLLQTYAKPIADSLRGDTATMRILDTLSPEKQRKTLLWKAGQIIKNDPSLVPELRGDSLCLRSSEIPYAKIIKDIRKDSSWMAALEAQGFLRTATMYEMLHAEVDRINAGKPLYKDQTDEIQFALQCQEEVRQRVERIPNNEKLMESIREKAKKYNKTLEQAIEDDAVWLVMRKYGLDHCRLIDDPDAEIPIPSDFQMK